MISQSPSDIRPVLDAIVASAARFCNAHYCYVDLFDGTLPDFKAQHGLPPEAIELIGRTAAPAAGSLAEQAATRREAVLVADLQAVTEAMPEAMSDELSRLLGIRSVAIVPLLKDGTAIGMMTVADPRPDALPTRRLTLLKAFADQAVIALDNARLSYETRTRAAERDSSLQQLAECTAERDEWRQRHAADVEAWELRHAAEMDEARRLHEAAAEEARQKFDASERQHAAELDEARRLYEAAAEEARQKFEAAQTQHAAEMDEAGGCTMQRSRRRANNSKRRRRSTRPRWMKPEACTPQPSRRLARSSKLRKRSTRRRWARPVACTMQPPRKLA